MTFLNLVSFTISTIFSPFQCPAFLVPTGAICKPYLGSSNPKSNSVLVILPLNDSSLAVTIHLLSTDLYNSESSFNVLGKKLGIKNAADYNNLVKIDNRFPEWPGEIYKDFISINFSKIFDVEQRFEIGL